MISCCFLPVFLLAISAGPLQVIDDVPFVKQESDYCGPASLSSVLSFYGDSLDQETIGKAVYSPALKGALITDLESFARDRGFRAESARGETEDLKKFIRKGKPLIVLVDYGLWFVSRPHYLVVYGYTDQGFLAHDGSEPDRLFPFDRFERIWERIGNAYLMVYPLRSSPCPAFLSSPAPCPE